MKKYLFGLIFLAGLAMALLPSAPSSGDEATDSAKRPVYVMTMNGAIGPAFSGYLEAGIAKAHAANAQLIIIELNTPGGLLTSTREMVADIIAAPVPIAVWVTPSGAHAASAGTFILYAAHIAAMDEGTNVGAATPIQMRGDANEQQDQIDFRRMFEDMTDPNAKAAREKAVADTAAFIRGLAEMRGRNAEWAEKAVTEADSITGREALEKGVIDVLATNRQELLSKINGKAITLKNEQIVTLTTDSAPVVAFRPDWKTRFLALITDPNIAMILMSIGVYGLILEFYNPGALFPGTIGAISLVIGLYSMNVLPINTAGAVLMILGIILIIAEAFMPSFGILGLGGLAAFIVGATIMFDTESMPGLTLDWGVLWGVAALGLLMVGLIVYMTIRVYKNQVQTGLESMIGKVAHVVEWSGKEGRVRIQGEVWHAYADDEMKLEKDEKVTIAKAEDLKLKITPDV